MLFYPDFVDYIIEKVDTPQGCRGGKLALCIYKNITNKGFTERKWEFAENIWQETKKKTTFATKTKQQIL